METEYFGDFRLVAEALVFYSNKNSLACLSFLICNLLKFDAMYYISIQCFPFFSSPWHAPGVMERSYVCVSCLV